MLVIILILVLAVPFALPQPVIIPVSGASYKDWHANSFWYEPWGSSGVHKGIDIFSAKGTPVISTSYGLVLWQGVLAKGGQVVISLGPRWRIHYYAHLNSTITHVGQWLKPGEVLGSVGDSGNARGKTPHLHYAIIQLIPNPLNFDTSTQGYKKGFYVDPSKLLYPH